MIEYSYSFPNEYYWKSQWSPCPVDCGDDIQNHTFVCVQILKDDREQKVSNDLCKDMKQRAMTKTRSCRRKTCYADQGDAKSPENNNIAGKAVASRQHNLGIYALLMIFAIIRLYLK